MIENIDDVEANETSGIKGLMKKMWPSFLTYSVYAFNTSALFINLVIISNLMWPGEIFHSFELGILIGITTYIMAISGILFGYLTDRISRILLFTISLFSYGFGIFLNGFAPEGQGALTFGFFVMCTVIRGFFSGSFWPIINSYTNDSTAETERSQFFGALSSIFQIVQIIGMVYSAFMFQTLLWRYYFLISGIITMIAGISVIKGKERKRAANHEELKDVLVDEDIVYDYKLNKETFRKTILSKTNIIAFVEGIFTTIVITVPDFLLVAYLQSEPYNMTPVSTSIFMIIFGIPGGIFSMLVLSKISDKFAKKGIKYRVYLIMFSIISMYLIFMFIFFAPIPELSKEEGNNIFVILSFPITWMMGIGALLARSFGGLYGINQAPVLQKINLPEAQGLISSSNQFLELIGSGTGPILAGVLLMVLNQNYQLTVFIVLATGIFGAFLWLLAVIWINKDAERISCILKSRRSELLEKNRKNGKAPTIAMVNN